MQLKSRLLKFYLVVIAGGMGVVLMTRVGSFKEEVRQVTPESTTPNGWNQIYHLGKSLILKKGHIMTTVNKSKKYPTGQLDQFPLHVLSKEEPYRSRMLDVRRRCDMMKNTIYSDKIDLSRFIFDDKHKAVMCTAPKTACATMKRIMLYLEGKANNLTEIPQEYLYLKDGNLPTLSRLSQEEAEHKLNTYTKFMTMRHPFERLVSAFNAKFVNAHSEYYMDMGKDIAALVLKYRNFPQRKKYGDEITPQSALINALKYGNITFEIFLDYLRSHVHEKEQFDVHWREQTMLCNPCALDYDFIIEFNSLSKDGDRLLDYLQRDDEDESLKIHVPLPSQHPINQTSAEITFRNIDQEIMTQIENIYKNDFYLFNYDPKSF